MSRRLALPGAEELLRPAGLQQPAERLRALPEAATAAAGIRRTRPRRRAGDLQDRRPSGRERHDEKITVYVSAAELIDLEQARLTLRGEHGMVVDRGRIVREALALVLADLEARGDESVLVRRLRGL
jgi:hypothetical protein